MSDRNKWLAARAAWFREVFSGIYHLPYLHGVLSTIGRTFRGFWRDDCHIMAAAISFYAVLSLIPFMLLLFSIAGYILNHFGQEYASQEELFSHLASYVKAVVPFLSEDFIGRLRGITLNREAYGVTGLVFLFVTAGLVFRTLELAFARVFKTDRHRSVLVHQLLFIAFIMGIGLVFLSVHWVTVIGSSVASGRDQDFATSFDSAIARYALLRLAVTLFSGTVVFVVLLKYFSRQRVSLRSSMLGGLLFASLWLVASKLFTYYLTHLARFSLLYGSLATPAVIVVWIFYTSCLLLLCTEFAYVLQNRFWPTESVAVPGEAEGSGTSGAGGSELEVTNPASENRTDS